MRLRQVLVGGSPVSDPNIPTVISGAAPEPGKRPHVACFIYKFSGAGTTVQNLAVARALADAGFRVDLVVVRADGVLAGQAPAGLPIVELDPRQTGKPTLSLLDRTAAALRLARYLKDHRPDVLLSGSTKANLVALAAKRLGRSPARVVLTVTNNLYQRKPGQHRTGSRLAPWITRTFFGAADRIIAVSRGVTDDLVANEGLPRDKVVTIHPPINIDRITALAREPLDHPWFAPGQPPVILGVGRLVAQKDFPTLVRAFGVLAARRDARLMILGEGSDGARTELLDLARAAGVDDRVALPGYDTNPYRYMAGAGMFALSSLWEGFGMVVAEALACGCPTVSTDCPSGPAEILDAGRHGALVPPGDPHALADAMAATLDRPPCRDALVARAHAFGVASSMDRYCALLTELTDPRPSLDRAA